MIGKRPARSLVLLLAPLLVAASAGLHLELTGSYPEADQELSESPMEIWLQFNEAPDLAQTSFSVRGPAGNVDLGDMATGKSPEIVRADLAGAIQEGEYTVSWVAAPSDDHPVRGRFVFSVAGR